MILENILKQKEKEIKLQKQNLEQMRMFLETKTPRIMYSEVDEVTTPDIITPK